MIYAPLEQVLMPVAARVCPELSVDDRRKSPMLVADLIALGIDPVRLPRCADLPELPGVDQVLGCLYVVEGATLGARVLHHALQRPDVPVRFQHLRFLTGYGPATSRKWSDFLACLERRVAFPGSTT